MNEEIKVLKYNAELYRDLYRIGKIDIKTAKEHIMPYINAINNKSLELSKKYNQKCKKVSFNTFCR